MKTSSQDGIKVLTNHIETDCPDDIEKVKIEHLITRKGIFNQDVRVKASVNKVMLNGIVHSFLSNGKAGKNGMKRPWYIVGLQ